MEKARISPAKLNGEILIPSSKSMGHREIICAGLAAGTSIVDNISMSKDIEATMRCLKALGVEIEKVTSKFPGRTALKITGSGKIFPKENSADCGESGSTLRFFVPLGASLGASFTFTGHGKLVSRPLKAYYDIFTEQGLAYTTNNGELPLTVNGKLQAGIYKLPGDVSSQYVSGLLFALPLLDGDSLVEITSPLESASYVDMTLACLAKYGIVIENVNSEHRLYKVKGGQKYQAQVGNVEGDWSQVAFWTVAGALGEKVISSGVDFTSLQGDKAVVEIMQRMGADISTTDTAVIVQGKETHATTIDATNCPDIIPALSALAAVSAGTTKIINAARLRIKECDRLAAMCSELNKLGAKVTELPDGLVIEGKPDGLAGGGQVDAWNDHRIAMSLAVVAAKCHEGFTLTGAGSVAKSYPIFWEDYKSVGGQIEVLK
ncbi:MAG: 3-phosphoshikimate 1-carboxyvinyltransferase [Phascolarctobacterium sp.]|nr:3-phosphoshikimate 1-carboxyvinyltransferase [Phascolarctobacterium sp.]